MREPAVAVDCEMLPNWCYILATAEDGSIVYEYERWADEDAAEEGELPDEMVTFNGAQYDLWMIPVMRSRMGVRNARKVSDMIIDREEDWQRRYRAAGFRKLEPDLHVDLMKAWIGASEDLKTGLKYRAAMLHVQKLPMFPDGFNEDITKEQAEEAKFYCYDDCMATWHVYGWSRHNIDVFHLLREQVPEALELNMPNIAERVWGGRRRIKKPEHMAGALYLPEYPAKDLKLPVTERAWEWLQTRRVNDKAKGFGIGRQNFHLDGLDYSFGTGGLHTNESCIVIPDSIHVDVSSYYPSLLEHLGRDPIGMHGFIERLKGERARRLKYKEEQHEAREAQRELEALPPADQVDIDIAAAIDALQQQEWHAEVHSRALKLMINALSGKVGQQFSNLYDALLYCTMTGCGQHYLLMLAEMLLLIAGAKTWSANTDGLIVTGDMDKISDVCRDWERRLGMVLEEEQMTRYAARDVNNWAALEIDGRMHVRGCFAVAGKHGSSAQLSAPKGDIIGEAAGTALLTTDNYRDAENMIWEMTHTEQDLRKFIYVRRTKAGGIWLKGGQQLGKTIRWVVGEGGAGIVTTSGSKIPNAHCAVPVYDLETVPVSMVHREWYHRNAMELWSTVRKQGSLL